MKAFIMAYLVIGLSVRSLCGRRYKSHLRELGSFVVTMALWPLTVLKWCIDYPPRPGDYPIRLGDPETECPDCGADIKWGTGLNDTNPWAHCTKCEWSR